MVLEDAVTGGGQADSFGGDDGSSYSGGSPSDQNNGITINMAQLPQPMPFFGPLTGHTQASIAKHVTNFIGGFSNAIGRPLTQEEATTVAFYAARMRRIMSWGDGLGITGGLIQAYNTSSTYKFPFMKPKENFNPDVLGPLRGMAARVGWHTLRCSAYSLVGNIFLGFLAQGYAISITFAGIKADARLKNMNEEMRNNLQKKKGVLEQPRQYPGSASYETQQQPQDGTWRSDGDDMSPTAGNDWDSRSETEKYANIFARANAGMAPEGQQGRQQGTPSLSQPPVQSQRSSPSPSSSFDPDSPTGGFGGFEPLKTGSDGSSGSAWDRLRQQAATGQKPQPQPRTPKTAQQASSSDSDPFDLTGSDDRSQAQRDFDARIDRERRGEDFESKGRRW